MLRIITGPFHPNLEQALVADLRRLKRDDPFAPAAIVVPSSLMLSRIRELVVLDAALPLLNVHFLTFHQLALRLLSERRLVTAGPGPLAPAPAVVSDLFFEQLLRRIARSDLRGLEALRMADLGPGTWVALWATVRDLKDGAIDPKTALAAVAEGQFGTENAPALAALFILYAAVLEASDTLGVGTVEDLTVACASWALESPFLRGLTAIYYYGFYDLTELQLALFRAVSRTAPVTLFFPLLDKPAYAFARRFFERHVLPLVPSSIPITPVMTPTEYTPPQFRAEESHSEIQVMSAVGPEDELTIICKEILSLVEMRGYRFSEIGVVSRSLQAYAPSLRRIFEEHRIPFISTAVRPALQDPAVKVWLRLARLPLTGFSRDAVLDVLSSPYYRHAPNLEAEAPDARPDLWRLAVNLLGIRGGEGDWARLLTGSLKPITALVDRSDGSRAEDMEDREQASIPVSQLGVLRHRVARLIQDTRALPRHGTVVELTDAFEQFVSSHVVLDRETPVSHIFDDALGHLRELDPITGTLSWEEWADLLTRLVERAAIPIQRGESKVAGIPHGGVQVLDAMAARGLPFRALFLLGLNEKVFPRFIQEDAFLRDRDRRVLEATLGYKIDEKLTGYDEEQLLFALLCGAAGQRLYLLYQRADLEGRPLPPSPYLFESRRPVHVPRRLSDRTQLSQLAPTFLTPEELILQLVLERCDPTGLLDLVDRNAGLFRNGVEALRSLEEVGQLGPHDGVMGDLERHWSRLAARGIAPTTLEEYARCPTRYFARHVLKLQTFREPPMEVLPPQALGSLVHTILRGSSERLVAMGWPATASEPDVLRLEVASVAEAAFVSYAAEHGIGYALLWDMAREMLTALVVETLLADEQDFRTSGYRPVAFEIETEGMLDGLAPELGSVKLRGRLDRVDRRDTTSDVRVVDYKFKPGRKMDPADRDLVTAAVRGFRLQPPLYALMRIPQARPQHQVDPESVPPGLVEFRFLAPRWEPSVDRSTFGADLWRGPVGERLRGTLRTLLEGVRAGRYVMLPGEYCDYCDFSTACRRFHGPSWWRAHNSTSAKSLRLLRRQRLDKAERGQAGE